ncbi:MAG: HDOD domain-containing protein [Nitrosomonadales bacterium]|nr:HDOD domain-containing protein [Nitrosomonadales bacterium]
MTDKISELLQGIEGLVTLPDVFIRINKLVEDPDSTAAGIAQAVSQDPSFTVRLLRVANSPFYGFSSTIDTVSRAVTVIGTKQIRNLALSTSVARTFAGLPNDLVSMENFWRHSLYCALIARILARQIRRCDAEAVFTAGLLHDIGELVIFNRLPEQAKESLLLVLDSGDELPVYQAEQQVMGFDHAQLGGELARQWNLPPMLQECIAFHHDIQKAQQYPLEAAVVHIANILALMAEVGTLDTDDVSPIDPHAWEVTGLDADEVIVASVQEAREEIAEAEKLFLGN